MSQPSLAVTPKTEFPEPQSCQPSSTTQYIKVEKEELVEEPDFASLAEAYQADSKLKSAPKEETDIFVTVGIEPSTSLIESPIDFRSNCGKSLHPGDVSEKKEDSQSHRKIIGKKNLGNNAKACNSTSVSSLDTSSCSSNLSGSSASLDRKRKLSKLRSAGERPFKCELCPRQFSYEYNFKTHWRLKHTDERPFKCIHCGQSFRNKGNLTCHLFTHSGQKPFECSHCGKRFSMKGNLRVHQFVHTGERPFECLHCDKKFVKNSDLKNHMNIHTGEKPYQCNICLKRYRQKSHLNNHLLTHEGKKPFECHFCERKFVQKGNLNTHLLTHS